MEPAQQRLGGHHRPGGERDHRLVDDAQLVALQGPVERALGRHPRRHLLAHGVVEDLTAGPSPELGPVHGGVGVAQQRVGPAVGLGQGDPEAAGEEDLLRADRERFPK